MEELFPQMCINRRYVWQYRLLSLKAHECVLIDVIKVS